uniref:HAD family hydrolase n=1 Tax=Streptomyces niveiscabiei TaxID=164115 RepID=UPI000A5F8CEC
MKLAFLDMDGTLFPGVVGKRYLRDLMEDGVCRPEPVHACLAAIDRYAAAPSSHSDALAEAYRQYALALHGVSLEQARRTATRSWQACRDQLFPFVGDLIALLKAHDYRTCLISGTGDLPVQEAVRDLGLNCGRGTVTEIRDGHFTDRLTCVPALPGGKAGTHV